MSAIVHSLFTWMLLVVDTGSAGVERLFEAAAAPAAFLSAATGEFASDLQACGADPALAQFGPICGQPCWISCVEAGCVCRDFICRQAPLLPLPLNQAAATARSP